MHTFKRVTTLAIIIAILGASLSFLFGGGKTLERRIAEITTVDQSDTVCPINPALLDSISTELLQICGNFGVIGYDAAKRYSNAARVFDTYGEFPEFREVLDTYGHQVVPVIEYFMDNGSKWMRTQATVADIWRQIKRGGDVNLTPAPPTPEQYGLMTIMAIKTEGHDFLGQFVFKDGEVSQVQLDRMWNTLKKVLTGGLINVERKARRGDAISFKDGAMAALDVAIIGGTTLKVVTALREMRIAAAGVRDITEAERLVVAGNSLTKSAQFIAAKSWGVTRVVAPVALVYVMVRHPTAIPAAGRWIAWLLGLPEWVGVVGIWAAVGLFISALLTPISLLLKVFGLSIRLTRMCHRACVWAANKTTVTTTHQVVRET
ncbi:MAG: hypothetical protein JWO50_216 [Candidatus Kaiserbacteria bacterium]|nr:hypothetical protein [Candidatus Kaiserbacteria bacterium]